MRQLEAFALLGVAVSCAAAAEPPRPRGVGPDFAKFYKSADTFTCISNPSITLPLSAVNDDYCDCPDGSDEPGTSACSHLSYLSPASLDSPQNISLALPGFYCKNKGHRPSYVPFTYVNDGVCDYELCCDGSDEWAGVGGVHCEDKCKEIGKEWRKQDEARRKSLGAASRRRKELVKEAERLRKEVEDRIETLQTEIQGAELRVRDLEKELEEVERKEKSKVIRGVGKKGGKLAVVIEMAKERIEELREAVVRVRGERDSSTARVKELEQILSTFKEEYNPNFNDEGVKRAVRAWEDYAARDKGPEPDAAHDRDLDEITKPDTPETGINWAEFDTVEEESDVDLLYNFSAYLPAPVQHWIDAKLHELHMWAIDNGLLANPASSTAAGSESQAVVDARNTLTSARNELNGKVSQLESHRADLSAEEYGPSEVFRALKGTCISTDSGEYTYELCFLDRAKQKTKKGGGETNMGTFTGLTTIHVDEEVGADGKGLGKGERIAMKHENGQHCWNGPNRSTMVVLACAEKDEIWKIVEEEKCVYRMEVGTAAVCDENVPAPEKEQGRKDEL